MYPLKLHTNLTVEKWSTYSQGKQILMIANELNRAKNWILKNQIEEVNRCYERAFELIDLTIEDTKWKGKLKEVLRFREVLGKLYVSSDNHLQLNNLAYKTIIALSVESYNMLH